MKIYDIYRHPAHGVRAVKQGFSWPAFLGGGLWALSKGMGRLGLALLSLGLALAGLAGAALLLEARMLALAVATTAALTALVPGRRGNLWWRLTLREQGYYRVCTVDGRCPAEALRAGPPMARTPVRQEPTWEPAPPPG
ncbi:MAG: hypothetical protein ACLFRB_09725 [Thiohalorhabdus sp.]|uniref:hypothetical protein n=1 Tax=Thiohalorhabdus sp. TaxID=3094134 RepID=UPI0039813529